MKVTISKVFISDKNKEGQPLVTKNGKPFKKIGIKTKEHGDKWLSSFIWEANDPQLQWQEGQPVDIVVEQNGQWLNFKVPTKTDLLEERVKALEQKVANIMGENHLETREEINPDEVPF